MSDEIIEEAQAPEPVVEAPAPKKPTRVKPAPVLIVRAKESFATTGLRAIRKGQLLPASDPIVVSKPHFFAPVES